MAITPMQVKYEGEISGAAIAAVTDVLSGSMVIPSANGQQVIILQ